MNLVELRDLDLILEAKADWEQFQNTTVLITGATGRLGVYLVGALAQLNNRKNFNIKIIAVARNTDKAHRLFEYLMNKNNFNLIIQDIKEPLQIDGEVNYIFHTAGMAAPVDYDYPVDTLWGHVMGTHNVLELAKEKKVRKVLYISTVEIYGSWEKERSIKEDDMGPLYCNRPRDCYPEAKRLCETMLACYQEQYGVDYVTVRMSHTLGPGIKLDDGRAFAHFIDKALKGEDIKLSSNGSAVRTYTYVADAVAGMFIAVTRGKEHWYNIANVENQITIRDLALLVAELAPGSKPEVQYEKSENNRLKYLPFKLGILNTDKMLLLGWKPKVDIRETFVRTMESFYK